MKGPPFFLLACFLGFDAVSASSHFTGVAAASQIPSLELSQDCLGSVSPDSIDKKLAEIKTAVATQLELNGGSDTQNFERELQRIFPDPNSQLARAVLSKLMVEQYGRSFNEYKENGPGRFGEQSDLSDEEVLEQGLSFEPELDRRLRELIELRKGFDEKFRAYVDESNDPERRLEQHVETGIVGMINPILGGLKYINDAKKSYHDGFDQELRSDALRMAELANSIARDFAYREDYTHVKSDLLDNLNNLVQPAANAQRELSLAKYNDYLSVLNKSLITLSAVQVTAETALFLIPGGQAIAATGRTLAAAGRAGKGVKTSTQLVQAIRAVRQAKNARSMGQLGRAVGQSAWGGAKVGYLFGSGMHTTHNLIDSYAQPGNFFCNFVENSLASGPAVISGIKGAAFGALFGPLAASGPHGVTVATSAGLAMTGVSVSQRMAAAHKHMRMAVWLKNTGNMEEAQNQINLAYAELAKAGIDTGFAAAPFASKNARGATKESFSHTLSKIKSALRRDPKSGKLLSPNGLQPVKEGQFVFDLNNQKIGIVDSVDHPSSGRQGIVHVKKDNGKISSYAGDEISKLKIYSQQEATLISSKVPKDLETAFVNTKRGIREVVVVDQTDSGHFIVRDINDPLWRHSPESFGKGDFFQGEGPVMPFNARFREFAREVSFQKWKETAQARQAIQDESFDFFGNDHQEIVVNSNFDHPSHNKYSNSKLSMLYVNARYGARPEQRLVLKRIDDFKGKGGNTEDVTINSLLKNSGMETPYLGTTTLNGSKYMVTEYIDGNLIKYTNGLYLHTNKITPDQAAQLNQIYADIHSRGIEPLDFQAIIGRNGRVSLIDVGHYQVKDSFHEGTANLNYSDYREAVLSNLEFMVSRGTHPSKLGESYMTYLGVPEPLQVDMTVQNQ